MKRRALLVLVCIAALLVIAVPVAQADGSLYVYGMAPLSGSTGTTATYMVFGSFYHPINALNLTPEITLTRGFTTITGYGVGLVALDGSSASVYFTIPNDAPAGLYDLNVGQTSGFNHYTDTAYHAFTVNQRPVITSLDPSSVVAGSAGLTLTVNGANFIKVYAPLPRQSVLQVNGTVVPTTYVSANTLTATIPASLLASPGTLQLVVVNTGTKSDPEVQSDPYPYVVKAPPAPTVASLSPASVWAGYVKNDVVLSVTGTNFVGTSRIALNGVEKTNTSLVSATQVSVPLAAADIATAGTIAVSVKNPPFPPGTPSATTLPLTVQAETTTPAVTISGATAGAWYNAPVNLTFAATDSQSGVQKIQYMSPPAVTAWTDGTSYTVPTTTQGAVTVSVQALDWCNQAGAAGATVNIDTTKPGTQTLGNVSVKKGGTAKLRFRVSEPAGLSPTATVTLKVEKSNGKVVKSIPVANVPVNSDRTQPFTCNLAKGTYTWYVYATDLAGNPQANIAKATLKVK
jgi:hypothetical protein